MRAEDPNITIRNNRKTEKNMEESLFVFHCVQRYMVSAYIFYSKFSLDRQLKTRLGCIEDIIDSLAKEKKDAE